MQDDRGLRRILSLGGVYAAVQALAGANRARRWLATHFWRVAADAKVVDVGCGTGEVLDFLPKTVRYVGFDLSAHYIARAQARYGTRAEFFVGTAAELLGKSDTRLLDADLVLCNGLLHHLEDAEVLEILTLATRVMKPGGRLVCLEPTMLARQVPWSRWMMAQDRGKNIRSEQAWKALVATVFPSFETHILTGLYRIPYTHIVIECRNAPLAPVPFGSPTLQSRTRPIP